jgi:hypothetical protein
MATPAQPARQPAPTRTDATDVVQDITCALALDADANGYEIGESDEWRETAFFLLRSRDGREFRVTVEPQS